MSEAVKVGTRVWIVWTMDKVSVCEKCGQRVVTKTPTPLEGVVRYLEQSVFGVALGEEVPGDIPVTVHCAADGRLRTVRGKSVFLSPEGAENAIAEAKAGGAV